MASDSPEVAADSIEVVKFDAIPQAVEFFETAAVDGFITTDNGKRFKLEDIEAAWNFIVISENNHVPPEMLPSSRNLDAGTWHFGEYPSVRHWIENLKNTDSSEDVEVGMGTISEHHLDALDALVVVEMDKSEELRHTLKLVDRSRQEKTTTS